MKDNEATIRLVVEPVENGFCIHFDEEYGARAKTYVGVTKDDIEQVAIEQCCARIRKALEALK